MPTTRVDTDASTGSAGGQQALILGIGNLLWADEGFGIRAVEHLHDHYLFPERVELLDGGTQGLNLMGPVQAADILVLIDAVDCGRAPGTLYRIHGQEVPRLIAAHKMSLHQAGMQEVLAGAELLGRAPEHLFLVGVQPAVLDDYGGSLSEPVRGQLEPATREVLQYLRGHGLPARPRREPITGRRGGGSMPNGALGLATYEGQRPTPEQAWRHGDPRVLGMRGPDGSEQ
ncbi:MAG: HyaD/HybD family hydrogenase maturation endopeptidase [Halorhodospira sp.]